MPEEKQLFDTSSEKKFKDVVSFFLPQNNIEASRQVVQSAEEYSRSEPNNPIIEEHYQNHLS